jgi:hypothetical protein
MAGRHRLGRSCRAGFEQVALPITVLVARYTADGANFDIYLPEWLAKHNKGIFGTMYLVGVVTSCGHWVPAAK